MDKDVIKHFAIDVLGCGCDHSVFNSIEVTADACLPCGVRLTKKILIGGRLLIYIAAAECCAPGEVEAVVRDGLSERNANGYNRLRLVIVSPGAGSMKDSYIEAFNRITAKDERCHIHIVRPEEAV